MLLRGVSTRIRSHYAKPIVPGNEPVITIEVSFPDGNVAPAHVVIYGLVEEGIDNSYVSSIVFQMHLTPADGILPGVKVSYRSHSKSFRLKVSGLGGWASS